MEKTFLEKLQDLISEAEAFLLEAIDSRFSIGLSGVTLITNEELEEQVDEIIDLPIVNMFGKYGTYDEYAVISVTKNGSEIMLGLYGKSEGVADKRIDVPLSGNLGSAEIIYLADLVKERI